MSIKHILKIALVLLLALSTLLSFVACNKDDGNNPTTPNDGNQETDPDVQLAFPQTDFKATFNILYPEHNVYLDFFFATEEQRGETVADAILTRSALVYNYLGVDVQGIPTPMHDQPFAIRAVAIELRNRISAGEDAYQMVLTQSFESVTPMVLEGMLLDFYSMDYIDLEADYWNKGAIDTLAVSGVGYYALSDYMISDPDAVFFNKEMILNYQDLEDPYTLVRTGEWTFDKLFEMCSAVDFDVDGLDDPKDGIYGLTSISDGPIISLLDAYDVKLLDDYDGEKILNMSAGNDAYTTLLTTVWEKVAEDWFYLYPWNATEETIIEMDQGTTLFSLASLKAAYRYRESKVKFGFLPYPKATAQQDYRCFDWSGMMCVPNTVQNVEMMEKTLEALSYFSTDTTVVAYYEKLLGGRLSDSPDDKEMLDIIWDHIVLNPVINYMGYSQEDLGKLVFSITRGCESVEANGKSSIDIASYFQQFKTGAQNRIDQILNGKLD